MDKNNEQSNLSRNLGISGILINIIFPLGWILGIIGLIVKKNPEKRRRDIILNILAIITTIVFHIIRIAIIWGIINNVI